MCIFWYFDDGKRNESDYLYVIAMCSHPKKTKINQQYDITADLYNFVNTKLRSFSTNGTIPILIMVLLHQSALL